MKILIVVHLVIPLLWMPLIALAIIYKPEAIDFDGTTKILGLVSFEMEPNAVGYMVMFIVFVLNAVFLSYFAAIFLKLLSRLPMIGNLKVSPKIVAREDDIFK